MRYFVYTGPRSGGNEIEYEGTVELLSEKEIIEKSLEEATDFDCYPTEEEVVKQINRYSNEKYYKEHILELYKYIEAIKNAKEGYLYPYIIDKDTAFSVVFNETEVEKMLEGFTAVDGMGGYPGTWFEILPENLKGLCKEGD